MGRLKNIEGFFFQIQAEVVFHLSAVHSLEFSRAVTSFADALVSLMLFLKNDTYIV